MSYLIDELEARADSIAVLTPNETTVSYLYDGVWAFNLDGATYEVSRDAFDKFLNYIRIPIKYVERCAAIDEAGGHIAESNINFWLSQSESFNFLLDDDRIVQVFPRGNAYIPGVKVNDFIIEIFDGNIHVLNHSTDGDVFSAIYLTDVSVELGGRDFKVGVKVLYSDCFNITPRFDGVLYDSGMNSIISFPTVGRKFRVSSATIDQILDQIAEFIQLSVDGVRENLGPAIKLRAADKYYKEQPSSFIRKMCAELRYSKKVQEELVSLFDDDKAMSELDMVLILSSIDMKFEHIDEVMKRNISIALGQRLITGDSFK